MKGEQLSFRNKEYVKFAAGGICSLCSAQPQWDTGNSQKIVISSVINKRNSQKIVINSVINKRNSQKIVINSVINKTGKLYSLENTDTPKAFFMSKHVGRYCTNVSRHCYVLGHSSNNVSQQWPYVVLALMRSDVPLLRNTGFPQWDLGSHCCEKRDRQTWTGPYGVLHSTVWRTLNNTKNNITFNLQETA
jgi:hypothetical protein